MYPHEVVAVVLAAGAGKRFGGGKMAALIDGTPLPAHVVTAVRAAGIERVVMVLGRDACAVTAALLPREPLLRAINPAPERGLASSLRLGIGAARACEPAGVLILLGDQPLVRTSVIEALLATEAPAGAVAIAPLYADDPAPNPVLLLPAGFDLVAAAEGDQGLGRLLATVGDRVVRVPVAGANPDIDTPADLADLASPEGSGR
jgi:molybdenum cofactor cytidylyltransferase